MTCAKCNEEINGEPVTRRNSLTRDIEHYHPICWQTEEEELTVTLKTNDIGE